MMENIGVNAMVGLYNGFVSYVQHVVNFVTNDLFGGIVGKALSLLGMNSPSKVFRDMGSGIVEGLTLGISENAHHAVGAAAGLATSVSAGFNVQAGAGAVAASAGGGRGNVTHNWTVNVAGFGRGCRGYRTADRASRQYLP